MLPALCDNQRLILGLVSGAASVVFGLVMIDVGPSIIDRLTRKSPSPHRSHPFMWVLCALSGLTAVIVPSVTGAAPSRVCTRVEIAHFECAPTGDPLDGEYVELANRDSASQKMNGWALCDQHGHHCYTFTVFTFPAQASVKLWSKVGTDTATDLYWGHRQPVWNNEGDTAFLRDSRGALVDETACPSSAR
jgi:hypothetical protein